jgi:rhodanese-related sulfurtransferase/mono/diheme cytochrome c family protein
MMTPLRAKCVLGAASILGGMLLSLAILAQEVTLPKRGDANFEHGGRLYRMHCQVCHGPEGDNLVCQDIVPLAGLGRRPRLNLVRGVLSPSYFFRGASYEGADARDLAAYLLSLKGEKGFDDPGLRCPPRLLSKRYGLFDYYRVIDVRDVGAYAKGHIPNAERWPASEEGSERQPNAANLVKQKLGLLAVHPGMSIVIYDDTVTPAAAHLWWEIVRAGHENVAILDGGLREWAEEDTYLTTVITPMVPSAYASSDLVETAAVRSDRDYPVLHLRTGMPQLSPGVFDWQFTVADGQLRTAAEIREYLGRSQIRIPGAYRVDGEDADASFLVYLLRLLGHNGTSYDPASKLLWAD